MGLPIDEFAKELILRSVGPQLYEKSSVDIHIDAIDTLGEKYELGKCSGLYDPMKLITIINRVESSKHSIIVYIRLDDRSISINIGRDCCKATINWGIPCIDYILSPKGYWIPISK